jgi:hypothetical protein
MYVLFKDMVSINYQNLIKTVSSGFEKNVILCFGAHLKGPYIRSQNDHIHQAVTCDG